MEKMLDKKTCFKIREICIKQRIIVETVAKYLDVSPSMIYLWYGAKKFSSPD